MAYTECYFHPSNRQTSSALYIYPLDTSKDKKQRVTEADIFAGAKKTPLISTTHETLKQALFSKFYDCGLVQRIIKSAFERKIGSSYDGIYQTNIWVYFLDDKNTNSDKKL